MPMIEFGSKKVLLFIHIPKTGGSSIEKWFGSVAKLRLKSPAIPSFMKMHTSTFEIYRFRRTFWRHRFRLHFFP